MRYLLAHIRDEKMMVGDNLEEMFAGLKYSLSNRRQVVLDGVEDGMSFSNEYTDDELPAQVRRRVLDILKSRGWVLYERKLAKYFARSVAIGEHSER